MLYLLVHFSRFLCPIRPANFKTLQLASSTKSMPLLPLLDVRQYAAGPSSAPATPTAGASPSAGGGSARPPNPLTILRNMQNDQFPLNLWLILLIVLSIFTLVHAAISGARRLRMYRILHTQLDTPKEELEGRRASAHNRSSLARLPVAALNAWRIVMFRWTLPFTDATLADAAINLGYVGLLLLWTFVACAPSFRRGLASLLIKPY